MPQKIVKLVIIVIFVIFVDTGYCLNLDRLKVDFLNGDYKSAILEGEKILAGANNTPHLDELYYISGLSYLKDGNLLRASDIFEIIIKEFKNSAFYEEAKLSLGDTYFLRGDYGRAQDYYKELIAEHPRTKWRGPLYYRLSQIGLKKGDTQQAKEYLDKLKNGFPLNLETKINPDLTYLSDIYYTVQVGSFSNKINAQNLMQKLIQQDYAAYIEEAKTKDNMIYRVRIGKCQSRQEVNTLENKLTQQGYPTKIYP